MLRGTRHLYHIRLTGVVTLFLVVLFYELWTAHPSDRSTETPIEKHIDLEAHLSNEAVEDSTSLPPCAADSGADDVFVSLKTGATEAHEKLPIHFHTTFRCIRNYAIFSDYAETIEGHEIHDVLDEVDEEMKINHPDFSLYHEMKAVGPEGVNITSTPEDGTGGKPFNRAWLLDKWKFLPMVDKALRLDPDKKWYFFIEADTYVMWSNLLQLLSFLDDGKPYYIGEANQIGPDIFAHGGAGFLLSNSAAKTISEYRVNNLREIDEFTAFHTAGDCVLGRFAEKAGVHLTFAHPLFDGSSPWVKDYSIGNGGAQRWCTPPITHHHVLPDDIQSLFDFGQTWSAQGNGTLLYRDLFQRRLRPQIEAQDRLDDWTNVPEQADHYVWKDTFDDCRKSCVQQPNCLQYSFEDGKCWNDKVLHRGIPKDGITSGWVLERFDDYERRQEQCHEPDWTLLPTPNPFPEVSSPWGVAHDFKETLSEDHNDAPPK